MNKTSIEWCNYTANPIRYRRTDDPTVQRGAVWACVKASEGCQNCYAESLAHRYQGREFTASQMADVAPFFDDKEAAAMLNPRRLPAGSRVFVGDMTDIFGPWVPFEMLDRLFAVFALRPDVVFQVLTKRPERMREYLTQRERDEAIAWVCAGLDPYWTIDGIPWPLPNVWLGTSTENQRWLDIRVPELLATPAAVRFLSCEPLLGELFLTREHLWKPTPCPEGCGCARPLDADVADCACDGPCCFDLEVFNGRKPDLDWVIVGGESGPKARPMDVAWARSIVEQCRAAGVACFVKQLGAKPREHYRDRSEWQVDLKWAGLEGNPPVSSPDREPDWWAPVMKSRKGGDMGEWPEDLRVREMPR